MLANLGVASSRAILVIGALTLATQARADTGGVKAGVLTCNVDSGWGLVLGSSRKVDCTYSSSAYSEHYVGRLSKYGVDLGYLQGGVMVWGVVAPTSGLAEGALTGDYSGVAGGASVGVGVDANVLFGGFQRSIELQPVSFEGDEGVNVAAGFASLDLHYAPSARRLSSR